MVGWPAGESLEPCQIQESLKFGGDFELDCGANEKQEYWPKQFLGDGRELTWQDTRAQLRDSTGRTGPSTWAGGHYPQGQRDYPVSGVSWYEAAAYATFAGKSLPTFVQWYVAAPPDVAGYNRQR